MSNGVNPEAGSTGSRWEWDNLLSLALPPGWIAEQVGDALELRPPDQSGTSHITFLRIDQDRVTVNEESAVAVLESFERVLNATPDGPPRVEHDDDEILVKHTLTGDLKWLVCVKLWSSAAVVFSFGHEGENTDAADVAAMIFDSITQGPSAA